MTKKGPSPGFFGSIHISYLLKCTTHFQVKHWDNTRGQTDKDNAFPLLLQLTLLVYNKDLKKEIGHVCIWDKVAHIVKVRVRGSNWIKQSGWMKTRFAAGKVGQHLREFISGAGDGARLCNVVFFHVLQLARTLSHCFISGLGVNMTEKTHP